MKKVVLAALLALAAMLSYAWAVPYFTVNNLTRALENEDAVKVEKYVDFARVKESFQDDFAKKMGIDRQESDSALSDIGAALATRIAGAFINGIVSPDTMVAVLKDKSRRDRMGLTSDFGEALRRGSWENASQFVLRDDYGYPTMLFERDGLHWRAVAMRIN